MDEKNTDEFYKKFKKRLEDTTEFPSQYLYKFIIPSSHKGITEIHKIFDGTGAQFQFKESRTGKYTSVTISIFVIDADQVIHYYKEAAVIPNIIML